MRILLIIHGYPMRYNAGSEVYTQGLAQALATNHEVHVFTRYENSFLPEYELCNETDPWNPRVTLHLINIARTKDGYCNPIVDQRFATLIKNLKPDVIHIGHLNHLSTSLVNEAAKLDKPILFTLHDYWLMCPRGQFIQMYPEEPSDVWALCNGQENRKCAERCYARYFSGAMEERENDIAYWTDWVGRRMNHIRQICDAIDLFIAPSQYLLHRFRDDFGLPSAKLAYLDYGFHLERFNGRSRIPNEPFTFGYIGTHIPAKGLHLLIRSFSQLEGHALLRIWGRSRDFHTSSLKTMAQQLPESIQQRIEWMGEYRNQEIVAEVFNHCDVIVVPSIWAENSPLVIHEALQTRVPVITSAYGGMAEYIRHNVNGLLFQHRNQHDLTREMQRLLDDPNLADTLGNRGYLQSKNGDVISFEDHVRSIEALYQQVIKKRRVKSG